MSNDDDERGSGKGNERVGEQRQQEGGGDSQRTSPFNPPDHTSAQEWFGEASDEWPCTDGHLRLS